MPPGRLGRRRAVESHFLAASLWCQARIVVGATGKTSAQWRCGSNRGKAAGHASSPGRGAHPGELAAQHGVLVAQHQEFGVLARSFRTSTAIRPSSQRTSWYTIDNSGIQRSSTTHQHTRTTGQDAASSTRAPHGGITGSGVEAGLTADAELAGQVGPQFFRSRRGHAGPRLGLGSGISCDLGRRGASRPGRSPPAVNSLSTSAPSDPERGLDFT